MSVSKVPNIYLIKVTPDTRFNLGFGDWLILVMMSHHLDIKLFTEILKEIKNVSFNNQRSVSTNVDIFCTSDSEREENFIPGDRDELRPPPITPLKGSPRSFIRNNSFMKKVRKLQQRVGNIFRVQPQPIW